MACSSQDAAVWGVHVLSTTTETIAGIPVPPLDLDMPRDKRFADLTGAEVEHLARVGDMLGRRGHEITTMWKAIGRRASESPFV